MKWAKRAACTIVGFLIFSVAVQILNYMYVADDVWERILWHGFYGDKGKIDDLFLGSSHVYCDIDPGQLDQLNGQYNFNLSSPGQLMNGSYYLLKEADRWNELSHVYVELYYDVSTKKDSNDDTDPIETNLPPNWRNTDYMRFSLNRLRYMTTMAGSEKYPDIFLGFSRYREHLGDWEYVETVIQRKKSSEYLNFQYHHYWDDGNGYEEYLPKGWFYSSREFPDRARLFNQSKILEKEPMGETSETYLREIITYCQKRDIPITLFISPIYELQLISTEHYDSYLDQVREIAAEYGLDLYDFNLVGEEYLPIQETRYFRDIGHLNAAGADLYTDFFYQIISGDAEENQKYFYDTYEQKLAHAEPEVYGIYYRVEEPEEDGTLYRNMFIASNREEGMEYKVFMIPDGEGEQYLIQDFSENRMFMVDYDEHGTCSITYRMKDTPATVQTIEITY